MLESGQRNNSAPLQVEKFLNVTAWERADEIFEDACRNCG